MKKYVYIQPQIKTYVIKANTLLAGSLEVQSSGTTSEQCAKSNPFSGFEFDNDEDK